MQVVQSFCDVHFFFIVSNIYAKVTFSNKYIKTKNHVKKDIQKAHFSQNRFNSLV